MSWLVVKCTTFFETFSAHVELLMGRFLQHWRPSSSRKLWSPGSVARTAMGAWQHRVFRRRSQSGDALRPKFGSRQRPHAYAFATIHRYNFEPVNVVECNSCCTWHKRFVPTSNCPIGFSTVPVVLAELRGSLFTAAGQTHAMSHQLLRRASRVPPLQRCQRHHSLPQTRWGNQIKQGNT